jgi:hypothetical protein
MQATVAATASSVIATLCAHTIQTGNCNMEWTYNDPVNRAVNYRHKGIRPGATTLLPRTWRVWSSYAGHIRSVLVSKYVQTLTFRCSPGRSCSIHRVPPSGLFYSQSDISSDGKTRCSPDSTMHPISISSMVSFATPRFQWCIRVLDPIVVESSLLCDMISHCISSGISGGSFAVGTGRGEAIASRLIRALCVAV